MQKVLLYSLLLVIGLIASQFMGDVPRAVRVPITLATMLALSFIMIHVGYEFEIDKSRPGKYVKDYAIAFTAAAFPWIFCALYFVYVMAPQGLWGTPDLWKEALLASRFASPTSAGVLFSMLAAAGLAATWVFKKARILAIFDDLDTILLMIPLKIMMVGFKWQLMVIVVLIVIMLTLAWRYLNTVRLPTGWVATLTYAAIITGVSDIIYRLSKTHDPMVPIHIEVLLPAFVLGCMIKSSHGQTHEHQPDMAHSANDARASVIISALFMVLVGLSMPAIETGARESIDGQPVSYVDPGDTLQYDGVDPALMAEKYAFPGWGMIAVHVLVITVISNIGKMFPAFCYKREAHWRERLAVAIGMFPRGEVGAGVLVVSLSYGIGGPILTVAVLSLALNLLLTGVFIFIVKKLIAGVPTTLANPSLT